MILKSWCYSEIMKSVVLILAVFCAPLCAQNNFQKIYETERAFERAVAEKGINQGFIEFLAADGVMFFPEVANGRQTWKSRASSPAALTWNPIWIDVSANGALAYSIGNSIYKAKGKDDPTAYYGHYISVWSRQPNGEYLAVLDTGINHEKPASMPTDWKSPPAISNKDVKLSSAAHSSLGFFEIADKQSTIKAYKAYIADDVFMMRDGKQPFVGRKAALDYLESERKNIKFAKRKSFVEAADLAYVSNSYSMTDKSGTEVEKGNFIQVWKNTNGKWKIVADVLIPIPPTKN